MPRYITVDTVSFTDKNGGTYPVKTRREFSQGVIKSVVNILEKDELDEIASRRSVFGEFGEDRTYQLVDANVVELKEAGFDVSKLKTLRIPI